VKEETPPSWEKISPNLQKTTMEKRSSIGTSTPFNSNEPIMISCIFEEDIPTMMKYYCKNFVDANDEDTRVRKKPIETHTQKRKFTRLWGATTHLAPTGSQKTTLS
jgi:hypothetical protein